MWLTFVETTQFYANNFLLIVNHRIVEERQCSVCVNQNASDYCRWVIYRYWKVYHTRIYAVNAYDWMNMTQIKIAAFFINTIYHMLSNQKYTFLTIKHKYTRLHTLHKDYFILRRYLRNIFSGLLIYSWLLRIKIYLYVLLTTSMMLPPSPPHRR